MTINQGQRTDTGSTGGHSPTRNHAPRRSTETKMSTKTTELIVYVGAVVAIVVTALVVGGDDKGSPDPFGAAEALRYITWLTIGYMIARGLAKSGSSDHYDG